MKKIKEINSHDIEMATLNKGDYQVAWICQNLDDSYVVTDNSYHAYSNSLDIFYNTTDEAEEAIYNLHRD